MEMLTYRDTGNVVDSPVYPCETEVCRGKTHVRTREGHGRIFLGVDAQGVPKVAVIVCPSCYRSAAPFKEIE